MPAWGRNDAGESNLRGFACPDEVWVGSCVSQALQTLGPIRRACGRTMMTGHCGSVGYWREALFIASATHGKIPCAGKGW
jgi:hypothetical protein